MVKYLPGAFFMMVGWTRPSPICARETFSVLICSFQPHFNLGLALLQKGQADQAMIEFRATLAIEPDNDQAQYNLGVLLRQKGQMDAAIPTRRDTVSRLTGWRFKTILASASSSKGAWMSRSRLCARRWPFNPTLCRRFSTWETPFFKMARWMKRSLLSKECWFSSRGPWKLKPAWPAHCGGWRLPILSATACQGDGIGPANGPTDRRRQSDDGRQLALACAEAGQFEQAVAHNAPCNWPLAKTTPE